MSHSASPRIRHELTFRVSDRRAQQLARHHRPILPRSLQRPVAVVEGNLTKNFNKTGVRLWTAPALDKHRKLRVPNQSGCSGDPSRAPGHGQHLQRRPRISKCDL
jgi:hypothetical protein